jgi:hypothetical protein
MMCMLRSLIKSSLFISIFHSHRIDIKLSYCFAVCLFFAVYIYLCMGANVMILKWWKQSVLCMREELKCIRNNEQRTTRTKIDNEMKNKKLMHFLLLQFSMLMFVLLFLPYNLHILKYISSDYGKSPLIIMFRSFFTIKIQQSKLSEPKERERGEWRDGKIQLNCMQEQIKLN